MKSWEGTTFLNDPAGEASRLRLRAGPGEGTCKRVTVFALLPEAGDVRPGRGLFAVGDELGPRGFGVRTTNGEPAGDQSEPGELLLEFGLDPPSFIRSEGIRLRKRGRGEDRFVSDFSGEGTGTTIRCIFTGGGDGGDGERVRGYEMLRDLRAGEVTESEVDAELEELAVNRERNECPLLEPVP
jgi:hypothetical protein